MTYHVVVPFGRDDDGNLITLEATEAPSADAAKRRARAAAEEHAGAIAFSRTGDLVAGDFGEAEILAVYGMVDVGMLTE
ncbi:MAG TPA: hypothetical protein VH414_20955 [Lichenihabitans sp.]|jgi:hypothetical protein|nr:hypothetical protein [Lichenihabitans sp.]